MSRERKPRARLAGEARGRTAMRGRQMMVLTARETEALLAVLENPPAPNERLRAAAREYRAAGDPGELG